MKRKKRCQARIPPGIFQVVIFIVRIVPINLSIPLAFAPDEEASGNLDFNPEVKCQYRDGVISRGGF
jgi:hypothetical protein